MKISVVTPTYNRATYLDHTIESIVTQKGDFDLEYIVQDGGSKGEVPDILRKWKERIDGGTVGRGCRSLDFRYFIEPDRGMYDAINRGFARSSGDVLAWLNSDDMYHPFALQTVAQIFGRFDSIHWLTGIPNSFNRYGSRSGYDAFPPAYSRRFLRDGCYRLACLDKGFNWIQQESCFWRRSLWEKTGGALDTRYAYAADFYLWLAFADHTDLVKVNSFLGGFRVHDDQFTNDPGLYAAELPEIKPVPGGYRILRSLLHRFPSTKKYFFNARHGFPFLNILGLRFADLVGRTVEWSFADQEWKMWTKAIL